MDQRYEEQFARSLGLMPIGRGHYRDENGAVVTDLTREAGYGSFMRALTGGRAEQVESLRHDLENNPGFEELE